MGPAYVKACGCGMLDQLSSPVKPVRVPHANIWTRSPRFILRGRIDVAWGTNRQGCHRPPGPLKASAIFWTDAFIGDKEPGAQRPRGKQNKNKTTDTPIHELHPSTPPQEGIGVCQTSGNRNAESRALGRPLGFPYAVLMPF
jgi:hypothetical protein